MPSEQVEPHLSTPSKQLSQLPSRSLPNQRDCTADQNRPSQANDHLTLQWPSPLTYFSHKLSRPQLVAIPHSRYMELFNDTVIIDLQHNMVKDRLGLNFH